MANYKIIKDLLPSTDKRTFGKMTPKTVVIHNTAMPASARNEATYVKSGDGGVTYHYAVDDKEAIQLLPLDKSGYHCGDGGTTIGGKNGIAIEICYSKYGGPKFDKAEDNAAHLAAKLLHKFNLGMKGLSKHQDWALDKKYCPHRTLDKGWGRFVKMVEKYYNEQSSKTPIMGEPTASLYQMQKWALDKGADEEFIELADKYIEYSKAYGVDPVVTYAQSAKETGFMKFGGVLDKSFKNPCGMKTRQGGGNYDKNAHQRFETWDNGIRAQAQHLALYAGSKSYPWKTNFDPRNFKSIHGTAPYVEDLGGKWAPSLSYGRDIVKMMGQIKNTKVTAEDIKMLQDNYADNLQEVKKIHDSEEAKMPEKDKIVIAYSADGDLANALALFNSLPDASMIRTSDATEISKTHKVIQVGGREIKGANVVLAGENRQETLGKISEWVEKQGK